MLTAALLSLLACTGEAPPPPVAAEPSRTCSAPTIHQRAIWSGADLGEALDPVEAMVHIPGPGLAAGDLDGDGHLDVMIALPMSASTILLGNGAGGLSPTGTALPDSGGLALGDLDGDGDLDVVLSRADADLVLLNDGTGRFTQSALPESSGRSTTPALLDLDHDGDLDLFITRYLWPLEAAEVMDGTAAGDGHGLYRNDGVGGFTDIASTLPEEITDTLGFQAVPLDVDRDGDLDVYLCNDFGTWAGGNALLLNDGTGELSVSDEVGGALEMFCMGAAIGDFNGDAIADMFLSNLGYPALLLGDGSGGYYDGGRALGVTDLTTEHRTASWGSSAIDLDGDGWEDLAITFGRVPEDADEDVTFSVDEGELSDAILQADALLLNDAGQGLTLWDDGGVFSAEEAHHALITVDLDRDGIPELMTAGLSADYTTSEVRLYGLEGGCGPGITLDLPMDAAGIGARVDARLGERVLTRWLLPSGTYSASAAQIHIGLGERAVLEEASITWADGTTDPLSALSPGAYDLSPQSRR